MNRVRTSRDNRFLYDKVKMRANNLPSKDVIRVLDAFGGLGVVWELVRKETGRDIRVTSIDKKEIDGKIYMMGDNVKFLKRLDFSEYDVIDLDAYGVPYEQLKVVFERAKNVRVFVTFIQTWHGGLPFEMMKELGFSEAMLKKSKTIFQREALEKFKLWLATQGVERIKIRKGGVKRCIYAYICFDIGEVR